MSRLAVTKAQAPLVGRPAMIRPQAMAFGLRRAMGAAALAGSLMARYRLAGTWPADAELQVLTPPAPGSPPPARAERARPEGPRPPLHIRLSADIRLLRRLLNERTGGPVSSDKRRARGAEPARLETGRLGAPARPERATMVNREQVERPGPGRREPVPKTPLPGPAVIRMPAPTAESGMSSVTVLRPIHLHAATETRSLLVIRSVASAEPSAGPPVRALRAAPPSRTETATREAGRPGPREGGRPRTMQARHGDAATDPPRLAANAERPALPGRAAGEPLPLEIVRREATSPGTAAKAAHEHPAGTKPLTSRIRAVAARPAAERTPKLAVRSRRGAGPSLDRRTLAGRTAPSAPRITPIIPRAVGQTAAPGEQAAPTRVLARRTSREADAAMLEGPAVMDSPAPVIAQPTARLPGAPALTPAGPTLTPAVPGSPRPQARGDQRRQAVALDVRRPPAPVAPPAPAAVETTERAAEPRGRAGQRTAEAKARPVQIDAPTLRKTLNEMPVGDFEPLADRLIAEFEWQLKRGLERSGRL